MADGLVQHLDSLASRTIDQLLNVLTVSFSELCDSPTQKTTTVDQIMNGKESFNDNNQILRIELSGVFVFRVFDEWELLALILHLDQSFLSDHPDVSQPFLLLISTIPYSWISMFLHMSQIGLIIIDSISFPFRSVFCIII